MKDRNSLTVLAAYTSFPFLRRYWRSGSWPLFPSLP